MSAVRPEVGDVWENDGLILYVNELSEDEDGETIYYCYDMNEKGYIAGCWYWSGTFINNAKYIGKSKAGIKDLFSVKENTKQTLNNESEE